MEKVNPKHKNVLNLAGKSIPDLIAEYKEFLFDDYLPFIDEFIFDHEYGGFKCNTSYFGRNISTRKRTWYDARGVWVYSYLYVNLYQDVHYRHMAEKTVSLLLKVNEDPNKLWPWAYNQKGEPLSEREPDIYGNLFVAEALSMYSQAVENEKYWEKSKDILINCMKLYEEPDYTYALQYSPDPSFQNASIVLGHWMIILRVCTGLLKTKEDQTIQDISNRCIDALIEKHQLPPHDLMLEVLGRDMQPVKGTMSQFVYIGHAIESLWMLMDEAKRREDAQLFNISAERFKKHVEVAWDDVYDGVFHCLDNIEANKWDLNKVLWAQHEVLIGLLILIDHKKDAWAIEFYDKMYNYVTANFVQKDIPFKPWKIGGNRHIYMKEEGERIENYHHPRSLMMGLGYLNNLLIKN